MLLLYYCMSILSFEAYIYDAVLLWAYGVNKTIEQGYSVHDGYHISKNIFNSSFEGMSGVVNIDPAGDRVIDHRYLMLFYYVILVIVLC